MGRRVFRNNYKGHMDKTKWGWNQGKEVGLAGVWRGVVGSKCRQLYLNNNKIIFKKSSEKASLNLQFLRRGGDDSMSALFQYFFPLRTNVNNDQYWLVCMHGVHYNLLFFTFKNKNTNIEHGIDVTFLLLACVSLQQKGNFSLLCCWKVFSPLK